jgi:hypothetical protein
VNFGRGTTRKMGLANGEEIEGYSIKFYNNEIGGKDRRLMKHFRNFLVVRPSIFVIS